MKRLALIVVAFLCGCASRPGLKLIDFKDADRATWAEPKATFSPSEQFLVHIRGYGGRKVTVELWSEPNQLVAKTTHDIPAGKTYRSYDGLVYDTRGRNIQLAERHTFYWTGTDYILRFKPLLPGVYELRLHSDDGRNESTKFTVEAYR
jgi:hypothetical protein